MLWLRWIRVATIMDEFSTHRETKLVYTGGAPHQSMRARAGYLTDPSRKLAGVRDRQRRAWEMSLDIYGNPQFQKPNGTLDQDAITSRRDPSKAAFATVSNGTPSLRITATSSVHDNHRKNWDRFLRQWMVATHQRLPAAHLLEPRRPAVRSLAAVLDRHRRLPHDLDPRARSRPHVRQPLRPGAPADRGWAQRTGRSAACAPVSRIAPAPVSREA